MHSFSPTRRSINIFSQKKYRNGLGGNISPKRSFVQSHNQNFISNSILNHYPSQILLNQASFNQLRDQDKLVEIERLQTTCQALQNRADISEDVLNENQILKRRLFESEEIRKRQTEELDAQNSQIKAIEKTQDIQRLKYLELAKENERLRQDQILLNQQKSLLRRDLDLATEKIIDLEEQIYRSNKISLELLGVHQVQELKKTITSAYPYENLLDLGLLYRPMKNDPVDIKIGEFINSHPKRSLLRQLLVRQTEGVYQYGTKKVMMKIENDQLVVRVGGGYIKIEEFLEQYTGIELEKLEKKDPQLRKLVSENEHIERARLQELLEKSLQTQYYSDGENKHFPQTSPNSPKQNSDDGPAESLLLKDSPEQL